MKRLRRKLAHLAKQSFIDKRSKRRLISAEWVSTETTDPNLVQNITDIMATGGQVQIQYNGEYKTILPYGWNSSKEGNVLLMCYKDTGEVRSYRLDRITEVLFDSNNLPMNMQMEEEDVNVDPDNTDSSNEEDILSLPDENQENELSEFELPEEQELPFDEALEIMDENVYELEDPFSLEQEEVEEELAIQ